MLSVIGDISFDCNGVTYGVLYASAWRDWDTNEVKVEWSMKFYSSEASRKRNLGKIRQAGRPVFLFELNVKQVAELGYPLPFIPDERKRQYPETEGFFDRFLFKK